MQRRAVIKPAESGKDVLWIATFLPVRSYSSVFPFIMTSGRLVNQAEKASGAVRYAMKTNIPKKHFWTVSVWTDRDVRQRIDRMHLLLHLEDLYFSCSR